MRHISSHGAIEIQNPRNENVFKVYGHRLKPYLELETKVNGHRLMPYLELETKEVEFVDLHDPSPFD